jgi:peptidoglycan hydrolase-like protein with peptidoglycan-binding domain
MPRITISYRRDDSGVITGRIFDRLAAHYGRESVFRDIDNIPPGADFREHIAKVLDESDILLAIVGPRWLGVRGGQTRLDEEADPVRLEIETGLRKQMPVIPVLVLRAAMPRLAQLPDSIKDFAYRQAVQVDAGQDFDIHSARLIRAMDRILQQIPGAPASVLALDEIVEPGELALLPPVEPELVDVTPAPAASGSPPAAEIAAETAAAPAGVAPPVAGDASAIDQAVRRPSAEQRHSRLAVGIAGGVVVGAAAVAAVAVFIWPTAPPDIMALSAAKQTAEAQALVLQAELTAAQKKTASIQDNLDAAQKQAADQEKRLAALQANNDQAAKELTAQKEAATKAQAQVDQLTAQVKALSDQAGRADSAEAAQKQLAAQLSTAQEQLAAAQKSLDQQAAQLKEAEARADKAEKDQKQLATQIAAAQDKGSAAQQQLAAQLSTAQDQLAAAQKSLDQQAGQLKEAQARADKAEQDQKQLATQVAAAQDKGSAAQQLLDRQTGQLSAANARADQAGQDLAAQKDAVAKARTQVDDLQAQVKSLSTQLASEKQGRAEAEASIAQLNDQIGAMQRSQPPSTTTSIAATTLPDPKPAPDGDDSTWSVDQRRQVQADLVALGHLQGTADGNFGPTTRAAIKQFQSFAGDPESGVMTDAEARALHVMAQRLAALVARAEASPDGVAAASIKGSAPRYQRAWAADKGSNGKPDPGEAVYWYGLAAGEGDAKAFTNLGLLLARGQGVPDPDPDDAALLWWAAAARGEMTAMFDLGALWENGIGVAADLGKAKAWYQRAAVKGDTGAQTALKRLGA